MKKKLFILGLALPFFAMGCSPSSEGKPSESIPASASEVSGEVYSVPSSSREVGEESSDVASSNRDESPNVITSMNSEESSIVPSSSSEGPVRVESVSLDRSSIVFYEDDPDMTLTATVLPIEAANKNVTWSSSNVSVATVDEGKITPISPGDAMITVKTEDGNKTATCKVSVSFPNYVIHGKFMNESDWIDMPMVYNEYSTAEYMLLGVQLYKDDVFSIHMYGDTWYGASDLKSSIPSGIVGRASTNNDIKVLVSGLYDIYSSYNVSDGGHIYIAPSESSLSPGTIHVSDILLNRSGKYLQYRHEYQLTATVYPSYASDKKVKWTSSDETIATVTSSGRVIAKEKTGTTVITATTNDQQKVDTCLIYVCTYETPEYFLTGAIGGRSYSYGTYTYAALPLGSRQYLIPNVNLKKGDEVNVMQRNGSRLRSTNLIGYPVYAYSVSEDKSVNMYLDLTKTGDYLTAVNRASRDIYVRYDADTNDGNQCAWIFVQGPDITPQWMKSNSFVSGSMGCRFNIPRHATRITFARADREQTPDNYYGSLVGMTRVKGFDILDDVYEYDATQPSE